ncbi:protein of unknown function [Burkholderia multivorans]
MRRSGCVIMHTSNAVEHVEKPPDADRIALGERRHTNVRVARHYDGHLCQQELSTENIGIELHNSPRNPPLGRRFAKIAVSIRSLTNACVRQLARDILVFNVSSHCMSKLMPERHQTTSTQAHPCEQVSVHIQCIFMALIVGAHWIKEKFITCFQQSNIKIN